MVKKTVIVRSRVPVILLTGSFCALGFALAMQLNDINGVPLAIAGAILGVAAIVTERKM